MIRLLGCCLFMAILPLFCNAQSDAIRQFYHKYKQYDEVTDIKLQGWMIRLAAGFTEESSAKRVMKKVSHLRLLLMENGNPVTSEEYRSLLRSVKKDAFEELIQFREGDEHIEFLIREDGKNTITDVLLLISGSDEFILISLEGALQFSDLNDLWIDIDGAEHFRKLPDDKKELPRA